MGCMASKTTVDQGTLAFARTHARMTFSEGGAVCTKDGGGHNRSAASDDIMTEGRHYCQFTRIKGKVLIGLTRPEYDVTTETDAHKEEGHSFFACTGGYKYPGGGDWTNMFDTEEGDRVGLLLDLEAGSLTLWKVTADELPQRKGMMAAGLEGPFCWSAIMYDKGDAVRVERLPCPKAKKPSRRTTRRVADDMTEDDAASAIQARVRSKASKKTDEVGTADAAVP